MEVVFAQRAGGVVAGAGDELAQTPRLRRALDRLIHVALLAHECGEQQRIHVQLLRRLGEHKWIGQGIHQTPYPHRAAGQRHINLTGKVVAQHQRRVVQPALLLPAAEQRHGADAVAQTTLNRAELPDRRLA